MYDLKGKVALVTGAGGEHGIGRAIAVRLAVEGADVIVNDVARRPHKENQSGWQGLDSVVSEITALGRKALAVVADITDSLQVDGMVREAVSHFGHIGILVNNAGALAARDRVAVVDLDESDWDRVQSVNVKGTFLCSRAVARHMIEHGQGGKIINMSSIAGKEGRARYAAYCASKAAVINFTQSLAQELAPHAINVNALCPCLVETERVAHMAAALKPDSMSTEEYRKELVDEWAEQTPLGRIAQPADVAKTAAYLASSEADYLTGLAVNVAGGSMMS